MEEIHKTEKYAVSEKAHEEAQKKVKKVKVIISEKAENFKKEKLEICAKFAKIDLILEESKSPEIKTCAIVGRGEKYDIIGSNAVLRYIANLNEENGLYGKTVYDSGLVDSWLEFCVLELETVVLWSCSCKDEEEKKTIKPAAGADAKRALKALNESLASRTYIVTEGVSIADITLFCVAKKCLEDELVSLEEAVALSHFSRWLLTCAEAFGMKKNALITKLMDCLCPNLSAVTTSRATPKIKLEDDLDKDPDTLFTSNFVRDRTRIKELMRSGKKAIGSKVTVKGWVRSVREAEKGATNFVEVNDGSCLGSLQIVATKQKTLHFDTLKKCGGAGSSMAVMGTIVESLGKNQTIELQADSVTIIGPTRGGPGGEIGAQFYPLAKKFHTPEHLRQHAHLRARSRLGSAVARTRHALAFATHEFFQRRGFLYIHTPLITSADAEGAGEQFSVTTLLPDSGDLSTLPLTPEKKIDYSADFFGRKCGLTVSGQLNVETHAVALSDCYTFGPTFRAENSHTSRHLAEFWMIEPEVSFADLYDDINLATDYLKYCVAACLARCDDDLAFFEQANEKGLRQRLHDLVTSPKFTQLEYTQAIAILQQKVQDHPASAPPLFENSKIEWGMDLGSEHEKYLTDVIYKGPVVLINYPKDIKAFYMKLNPDNQTVAAMDILVPKIGEIIGGSQREDDLDVLEARCRQVGIDPKHLSWYTDLRKYGSVPHAGFGLGFERLVMLVTGCPNIRDVIPFPRYPGNAPF